jgi:hypothetical protein
MIFVLRIDAPIKRKSKQIVTVYLIIVYVLIFLTFEFPCLRKLFFLDIFTFNLEHQREKVCHSHFLLQAYPQDYLLYF